MDILEFYNIWQRLDNNIKVQLVFNQRYFEKRYDPKYFFVEESRFAPFINIKDIIASHYLLSNIKEKTFEKLISKLSELHTSETSVPYFKNISNTAYFNYFDSNQKGVNLSHLERMTLFTDKNLSLNDIDFNFDNFYSEKNLRIIYRILKLKSLILKDIDEFDSRLPINFLKEIKHLIIDNISVYYPNNGERIRSTDGILEYLLNKDLESIVIKSAGLNHLSKIFQDMNLRPKERYGKLMLPNLKLLCLHGSTIQSQDLKLLNNAQNLEYLDISRTNVVTIEDMPYLSNLKLIDISFNRKIYRIHGSSELSESNLHFEVLTKYKDIVLIAHGFDFIDDEILYYDEEKNDYLRNENGSLLNGIDVTKYFVNKNNIVLVSNGLPYEFETEHEGSFLKN